jgi:hypothetical protein
MARDHAHVAFYGFTLAAAAGWLVALGGVAALQSSGCSPGPEDSADGSCSTARATLGRAVGYGSCGASGGCTRWLGKYWFALAYHLLALALTPLSCRMAHFKAVRGAVWALLASACIYSTQMCNATLSMALSSAAPAAAAAAAAGLALLVAFSFGVIGAGSALAHSQRRAALGGVGPESKLWRRAVTFSLRALGRAATGLFRAPGRARAAAAALLALAAAGWAVALGGVVALQATCSRDPAAMRAFRLAYYPYPSATDNAIDCGRAFAELWWAWALMTATLAVAAGVAAARQMARFRAAGFALLVSCATYNFIFIAALLSWSLDTAGAFQAAARAALAGFIVFDVGALALLFAGAAHIYCEQRAGLDSVRVRDGDAATGGAARRVRAARAAFAALQAAACAALVAALAALALIHASLDAGAASPTVAFYARMDWYIWAASLAALALAAGVRRVARLARFKGAAWLLLVYAANLSMLVCARTYKILPRLGGDLRGRVIAQLVAFCVWDACAYLLLFVGSAVAWEARGAAAEARGGEGEDESADEAEEREAAAGKS